jgi:hypothetical protein
MKTKILLLIGSLLMTSIAAEAQILKRLQQKAEQAVEKAVERKVDQELEKVANQMVEKSWDNLFGSKAGNDEAGLKLPFTSGEAVNTESEYLFESMALMKIEGTDKQGKATEPIFMEMYFPKDAMFTGTKIQNAEMKKEQGDVLVIYDFANEAMLMLMEAEEGKFSFAYGFSHPEDFINEASQEPNVNWEEVEEWNGFTRIGTKEINGFACEGYRTEDENGTSEVWVTRDETIGMEKFLGANGNTQSLRGKLPSDYPYGTMVQTVYSDKNSKESFTMTLEELQKNINIRYRMIDYPQMSIGDFGK